MLYHSGARNFECSICSNKFFQMEHLKRHMQSIHHQELNHIQQQVPMNTEPKSKSRPMSYQYITNDTVKSSPANITPNSIYSNTENQNFQQENTCQSPSNHASSSLCYKVTSKCTYKCHRCEFSTAKIYALNEHMIGEHVDDDTFKTNSKSHMISLPFICSFCSYKTDKKNNLKRHLQNNHSSQFTAPLLLSNDAIMVHPNTRFQCGLCRRYFVNMDEFVKHMTDKHKMHVYILDSNNESTNSVQEQLKNRGRAEVLNIFFTQKLLLNSII